MGNRGGFGLLAKMASKQKTGFGGLAKTATPTFNPDVEHNKAMKKVEELALEEGFGTLAKTATVYNSKFYL